MITIYKAPMNFHTHASLCGHAFSFLIGKYLGVEWQNHIVSLPWKETALLFPRVAAPLCVPISCMWEFQLFHILLSTSYCPIVFVVICCVLVILIVALSCIAALLLCISLMTHNAEHLSMCLLAIFVSSLAKCLFRPFAYFCIVLFVFLLLNCTMPDFLKLYLFKYRWFTMPCSFLLHSDVLQVTYTHILLHILFVTVYHGVLNTVLPWCLSILFI